MGNSYNNLKARIAVNVGGKSALSMKALATALGDAGYADVRTLIASGYRQRGEIA